MVARRVRPWMIAGVALLVLLAGAVAVVVLRQPSTPLAAAVATLPEDVLRVSFTDWAEVAAETDGAGITASSPAGEVTRFLDRAFDRGLLVTSALDTSFAALAANFGITPLDADWEVYGQSPDGAVSVLRLADDVDLDALEGRLADLGYDAPAGGSGSGGVWTATPDLLAGLPEPFPTLQVNVAVLHDRRTMLMSDAPETVEHAVKVIQGEADSLAGVAHVGDLVAAAEDPSVAQLWVGDFACQELRMGQADATDQAEADRLVTEVGGVNPLSGLVFAQAADLTLRVGMAFSSDSQAGEDLQRRVDLAAGAAPGQGGSFSDRFEITDAVAQGEMVRLELTPVAGPLLSDLGQGPVLFATC